MERKIKYNSKNSSENISITVNRSKYNTDWFKKKIYDLVGDEYTVLGEYQGNEVKILMKHNKCGHEYETPPKSFITKGRRCPKCRNKKHNVFRKTQEQFEKEVYDLVGDEYTVLGDYINNVTHIKMKHNICGHEYGVNPNNFLKGNRCPKCSKNASKTSKRKSTKEFKKEVYDLVGDEYTVLGEYINNNTKILIRHNTCGHEWKITPVNFLRGNRCPKCKYINGNYDKKTTEEFKKKIFSLIVDEYSVLGEYVNSNTKIKFKHNICNNVFETTPLNFIKGKKCPKCYDSPKKSTETFKKEVYDLVEDEYTVLGEYIASNKHILMRHNKCGYEWNSTPTNFLHDKSRCPKCSLSSGISDGELEILKYVKKIYKGKVIHNCRSLIKPLEVDIYIPDKNLAIEYNGLYWHSEDKVGKDYHINKTNLCKEQGVQLIHIFEDEWLDHPKIIKDKLKTLLGCNTKKIYARECIIKEITPKEKNNFLNKYHIQGKDISLIKLGLFTSTKYYEEETLVAVMTFCKPRKALGQSKDKTNFDYELSRYASIRNYNILGGFSKLLKYFERNYEWKKIITYADKRWSNGKVYLKNGFINTHDSKPSYWYSNNSEFKRYYRYTFRKSALKDLFPEVYSDDKTEREIMEEMNYYRIYDCGNMVFEYTKN